MVSLHHPWEKCVSGLQIFELASWAWLMLNATHEMIDKIHNIVLEDHRVKMREISKIGISNECVYFSQTFANEKTVSKVDSAIFVMMDETWIHYHTPQTTRQ